MRNLDKGQRVKLAVTVVVFLALFLGDCHNRRKFGDLPWWREVEITQTRIEELHFQVSENVIRDATGQVILTMDVQPIFERNAGGWWVPMRFFFEALDLQVEYSNLVRPTITVVPDGKLFKKAVIIRPDDNPSVFRLLNDRYYVTLSVLEQFYPEAVESRVRDDELILTVNVGEMLISVQASTTMDFYDWFEAIVTVIIFAVGAICWSFLTWSKGAHLKELGRYIALDGKAIEVDSRILPTLINSVLVICLFFALLVFWPGATGELYWCTSLGMAVALPSSVLMGLVLCLHAKAIEKCIKGPQL